MDKFDNFIWFGDQAINLNWVVRFLVTNDGTKVTAFLKDAPADDMPPFVEGEEAERLLKELEWQEVSGVSIESFGGASHAAAVRGSLASMTVDAGDEVSQITEIGRP